MNSFLGLSIRCSIKTMMSVQRAAGQARQIPYRALLALAVAAGCSSDPGSPGADVASPDAVEARTGELYYEAAAPGCLDDGDCPSKPPCLEGECDPQTLACSFVPVEDGTACDDGNSCTANDECSAGECVGAQVSCDDGNPCTADGCDTVNGECLHTPVPAACDDYDLCTSGDKCSEGVCTGEAVNCDDDNPCTSGSCSADKGCLQQPVDGVPCDDGDLCTGGDQCQEGECEPGVAKVCDDGNVCTSDACAPDTGECVSQPANQLACDDNNACTLGDSCHEGVCSGSELAVCDDLNPCTDDGCDPQSGCVFLFNEAACDDGNPCTQGDSCSAGVCSSGAAKDCFDGNPCTFDSCDGEGGECLHQEIDWPCDDSNPCTGGDVCAGGICLGQAVDCDDLNPCTVDSCDSLAGGVHAPTAAPCSDGNLCTLGDVCLAGVCLSGPADLSCDDGSACTFDSCNPSDGSCTHEPTDAACDDGNPCTLGDHCAGGVCQSGQLDFCDCQTDLDCLPFDDGNKCNGLLFCDASTWPNKCKLAPESVVECSDVLDTHCLKAQCDPDDGNCYQVAEPDGALCDDDDLCTQSDQCLQGVCLGGGEVACDDGNLCTAAECQPDVGCVYSSVSLPCNDGNLCTVGDSCLGGNCIGLPKVCEDGNPCTTGVCDPGSGECDFHIIPTSCDDENPCTVEDQCVDGVCTGVPRDCTDDYPCTSDACHPSLGCIHSPLPGECDDGNGCTVDDQCSGVLCVGVSVDCDDDNVCTDDLCQGDIGCFHQPNVAPCNDQNACTYGDMCNQGECQGLPLSCVTGNPCTFEYCDDQNECTEGDWCVDGTCYPGPEIICYDNNECTLDFCKVETGECHFNPLGKPCDDEDLCTTFDLCSGGDCAGFPVDCDDANGCTSDSCDPVEGCLHAPLHLAWCDDNDPCTTGDYCEMHQCLGTGSMNCNDNNQCTLDECQKGFGCQHLSLDGVTCDDGDEATVHDLCVGNQCVGAPDPDLDGIPDEGPELACVGGEIDDCADNCAGSYNPEQGDADGDGVGDVCEICGEYQVIDGETPPVPELWSVYPSGACPDDNHSFSPVLVPPEAQPALAAVANRQDICTAGAVSTAIVPVHDLSGHLSVVEADVEFGTAYCPPELVNGELAEIAVVSGQEKVTLFSAASVEGEAVCGPALLIAPADARASWRFEFNGQLAWVRVYRGGIETSDSPYDLSGLEGKWQLSFAAAGGDLDGGAGSFAVVRIYAYTYICNWQN